MSNNHSRRLVWDVVLGVLCALLGVAATIGYEKYEAWRKRQDIKRSEPQAILDEASRKRRLLIESSLESAAQDLKNLEESLDKNSSLDDTSKVRFRALTYAEEGRTFADWATLRNLRGLSRGDYPQRAQYYAMRATTIGHDLHETQISLAYALDAVEADQSSMPATKNQVQELLKGPVNDDIRYLSWQSEAGGEEAKVFPDTAKAEGISDLVILLQLGMHFARSAQNLDGEKKQLALSRAEEFLAKASRIAQNNAVVLFAEGFAAAVGERTAEAREYYRKAVEQEPAFPRARNNWGYTFAAQGLYLQAKEQFEAAVEAANGAPTAGLGTWLDNLGYASLEVGDNTRACQVWTLASGLALANDNPRASLGMAMCHYLKGEKDDSVFDFRRSVKTAENWNKAQKRQIDPLDIHWYEKEKAGPKEMKIAKDLIQLNKLLRVIPEKKTSEEPKANPTPKPM